MHTFTRNNLLIAACYAGTLILGMLLGPKFAKEKDNTRSGTYLPFTGGRSEKVDKILRIIDEKYVDSVETDTLQTLAIQEILKRLDPHSHYLPPHEAQYLHDDLEGHFSGIGIEYSLAEDTVLVTAVLPESPAGKAGLKAGDQILQINDKPVTGSKIAPADVVEAIRGRRGTTVNLVVKYRSTGKTGQVAVKRDDINISSVDIAYMLNKEIGYVKISRFGAQTDADFRASLKQLQQKGMKKLILDLRENGGGYLRAATDLADEFLPSSKLIVYTQGLHEPRTDYIATDNGMFENGKLVVLIDEKTASASEIVAGAIQDLDRGVIIGRRSFGKGLVQEQFNFGDGSVLNLSVAKYYTPSGRSIQRPYKNGTAAYFREAGAYSNGADSGAHWVDSASLSPHTYKTSSGRLIYSGGGINPDIYIPADTAGFNEFYYQVSAKGLFQNFLFNYLVKSHPRADKNAFLHRISISDAEYQQFVSLALAKGVKASAREIELAQAQIAKELKALLGRYYYQNEMFYQVLNQSDRAIAKSLAVLTKD